MLEMTNLDQEKTIIAKRKHWIHPFLQVGIIFLTSLLFFSTVLMAFSFINDWRLFLYTAFVIFIATFVVSAKTFVDWYFHFYVITTKRIIEISHSPMFFSRINGLLIDQIRCIEIEERRSGIIKEIFDYGDVVVKYDSATRSDSFRFSNIPSPSEFAYMLNKIMLPQNSPFQYQQIRRNNEKLYATN